MRICTLLFFVLSSFAFAQGEPELKSSDLKKISKYTVIKNNLTKQDLYNNVESLFEVIRKDNHENEI